MNRTTIRNIAVASAIAGIVCPAAFGADNWVVPLGTPEAERTVSASVTYDNITTSEKIIVTGGATLATKQSDSVFFTVASDAVPSDGVVDAARIEANSTLAPDKFRNQNASPARIVFAGQNARIADDRGHLYLNMFSSGSVILHDATGDGINIAQTGSTAPAGHGFNANNVSVRLTGAGDVTFSRQTGYRTGIGDYPDGRMPWVFRNGASIQTTGAVRFTSNRGGTYWIDASGLVADSVTDVTVSGPDGNTTEDYACYLQIQSGVTLRAKSLTANFATRGRVLGAGAVEMGADDSNGTFDAVVRGNALTLRKIGAGTLTVGSSVTNIPALAISGGTVNISTSFPIGSLSIAEGASLVIDGATVTLGAVDAASLGRVSVLNGGKVVFSAEIPNGTKVEMRNAVPDNAGIEYVQTGGGTSVVFCAECPAATLHAVGGTIMFSAYGMTDRFLRFTFKRTWGWLNYSGVRQAPSYLRLVEFAFYDAEGTRIFSDPSTQYDVADVVPGSKTPDQLTGVSAMAEEGTVFDSGSGATHTSMTGLFNHTYNGWYPYFKTYELNDDAFAAGHFERFYFHSNATDPAIHGYNMASPLEKALPRTWTIEASPDGTDGSWYVVSDVVDYDNGNNRHEGWLNGVRYEGAEAADQGLCMVFTNYVSAGVSPNASPVSVQVENGAVIDFSNVTGGQSVNRIAYDPVTGGGTVNAARIAPNGTLELSEAPASYDEPLSLRLANAQDSANLRNWTVKVRGAVVDKPLTILSDGTVAFRSGKGTTIVFY